VAAAFHLSAMTVSSSLAVTAAVIVSLLGGGAVLLQIWFLAELKRWDRAAWESVASPHWLQSGSLRAMGYIQSGRYRRLQNSRLRSLGLILRVTQLMVILLALGLLLVVVF